jgi:glyoxylase-like metal-dependent hydrolase (beta-lactamase superfamily II)
MPVEQIKVGLDNFSYLIFSPSTKKSAIVDPGFDASPALRCISSKNLELLYIINTHYHSDHSGANERIKKSFPSSVVVASELDGVRLGADKVVSDGDQLMLGEICVDFILTPGHTPGSLCLVVDNEFLLTGDTLFIGDCGRTDLPGGSSHEMYKTLQEKIKILPDHLIVYPGHDYGDKPFDTLGNQKRTNKTLLARNLDEFLKIP